MSENQQAPFEGEGAPEKFPVDTDVAVGFLSLTCLWGVSN